MKNINYPAVAGVSAVPVFSLAIAMRAIAILSASFVPFQFAHAQFEIEEPLTILITASRTAETADETLSPVTVITRKEIEESQSNTVEEVLRTVPGLTMSNNGGAGQVTTLFLRGTNSDHVLVLIDGVKVGSAINGLTQFEHLPLDQIEKIEVVRGPRSSLYGSEAIGGVIQIFTRKGSAQHEANFTVSAGSHSAKQIAAGVSDGGEKGWYRWGVSTEHTDGYDVCRASFCIAETDDDGHKNIATNLRVGKSITDSFTLEGNFLDSESETEFDGFYNSSENSIRTSSIKSELRVNERWQTAVTLAQSEDNLESFRDGVSMARFVNDREQINWQNTIQLSEKNRIVAGVDYVDDEVSGTTNYDVDSRDNLGVFASLRTAIAANELEFSLRSDDDEQFGKETTGSIGWGRAVGVGKRVTASIGTAFKAPNFSDLYEAESDAGIFGGTDFGIFRDNPDLQPETSNSIDVGFANVGDHGTWGVNLYQTTINDLIANRTHMEDIAGTMRPVSVPTNIEQAEIAGVELTAATRISEWNLNSTISWQEAEETKGTRKDKPLLKRPEQKLDLDFSRSFGKHLVGVNVYSQSDSLDFGETEIDSFTLVNLRGELRVEKNWSLGVKINNLFDEGYETTANYPQDGLNVLATLRYLP